MRQRRWSAAGVAMVTTVVLAGCGSSGKHVALPTVRPAGSATSTTTSATAPPTTPTIVPSNSGVAPSNPVTVPSTTSTSTTAVTPTTEKVTCTNGDLTQAYQDQGGTLTTKGFVLSSCEDDWALAVAGGIDLAAVFRLTSEGWTLRWHGTKASIGSGATSAGVPTSVLTYLRAHLVNTGIN